MSRAVFPPVLCASRGRERYGGRLGETRVGVIERVSVFSSGNRAEQPKVPLAKACPRAPKAGGSPEGIITRSSGTGRYTERRMHGYP